jgi:prepilin-type N-terminal cleavage/methylation domain-containing protein
MPKQTGDKAGFTLLEVVVGIALLAIAVLGLAEMFMLSISNNARSDRITNANFLAQQQVDVLRSLTLDELTLLASSPAIDLNGDGTMDVTKDQLLDINLDNVNDYRRIIDLQQSSTSTTEFELRVMVFTPEQFGKSLAELLQHPEANRVRAKVSTIITR